MPLCMQTLRQDVLCAVRLIRHSPGFAAVTILTLALGIGANTAIFSILDALVLRILPVWQADRLVQVTPIYRNGQTVPLSFPMFQQLQDNQRVFSALFGWTGSFRRNLEVDNALVLARVTRYWRKRAVGAGMAAWAASVCSADQLLQVSSGSGVLPLRMETLTVVPAGVAACQRSEPHLLISLASSASERSVPLGAYFSSST